jgi:hypothetical protein
MDIPLPIKSSMYFQKNCITNINMEIQKVTRNGPIKDRILKTYKRFNFYNKKMECEIKLLKLF